MNIYLESFFLWKGSEGSLTTGTQQYQECFIFIILAMAGPVGPSGHFSSMIPHRHRDL